MSKHRQAKVSLGLPVYNGERFVGAAIESMLAQTFTDFELIISDNASTDRTQEICEEYAQRDARVRYFRQEINVGAKANFNRVFEYSRGEYFKWVAADDVCGPRYLELTVGILDSDPSIVLAHTASQLINGQGEPVSEQDMKRRITLDEGVPVLVHPCDRMRDFTTASAHKRFREILLHTVWCFEIFALIRRDAMLRTYPKGAYYGSDKVMLAELALLGRFVESSELQFFRRAHHGNSTNMTPKARETWSRAPKTNWKLPTQFPCLSGYMSAALSFPIAPAERIRCVGVICHFLLRPDRYRNLAHELVSLVRSHYLSHHPVSVAKHA
jgi:glycosyltransferase involved in cell wall biosynthesis